MTLDLRTTSLALSAWAGAAAGWCLGWPVAGTVALPAAALVVSAGRRAAARHAALAVVALALGAAVAALGAAAREPPASLPGATAEYVVAVTTEPRPIQAQLSGPAQLVVGVSVTEARLGAQVWELAVPARLVTNAADWLRCAPCSPGAAVRLHATLAPLAASDTTWLLRGRSRPAIVTPPQGGQAAAASVRAGLREALSGQPPEAASLVSGLSLGDESQQSPDFAATMQAAGLSHLTAVSGGNLVIVLLVVLVPLRVARVPVSGQVAGCVAAVCGYVWLVGPQPSVLRAAVMAGAGLAGILLGGPARGFPILFGGAFLLLLVTPELALSLGFALSVAATAGLQVIAPPLARRLRRVVPDWLALALGVTLAAQLTSAPILLATGRPVSLVAVPANLAAAPLVAPVTVAGLAAALLAIVAPGPAAVMAGVAAQPAAALAWVAHTAEELAVTPGLDAAATWGVIAALALGATRMARHRWPDDWRLPVAAVVTVLLLAGMSPPWRAADLPADWRAVVCDVGQGTAVLLRTADGAVLVDTGPPGGDIGACLRRAGVAHLDAVVLSHYHADHVGALATVLAAAPAAQLAVGPALHPAETVTEVATVAAREQVPITVVAAGQQLRWDGLTAAVLWPRPGDEGSADDVNDSSLVLVARFDGGGVVLLPGDVEPDSQTALLAAQPGPAVDVVVIPHHGSRHQDPRFVAWSGARAAVASAGADNSYGHPSAETLAAYQATGAAVGRTDADGTVAYVWRDGNLLVSNSG